MLRVGTESGSFVVGGCSGTDGTVLSDDFADGLADELAGQPVTAAAPGGWAVAGGHVVLRGGREVARLDGLVAQCLLPSGAGVLVGTSGAHVVEVGPPGRPDLLASFDAIASRDDWYTPWGAPPDTRSMAGAGDGVLLVNVHVGGVWRREPEQSTWDPVVDVDTDTHQVLLQGDDAVAAAAVGFGYSPDGGRTWDWTDDGLDASYCRAVALAGDVALVTASTGPGTRRAAVYRRPVAGRAFERCRKGLPEWFSANIDTACLAASGALVAFGTADGDVYVSFDQGRSWERAASGLPPVRCIVVEGSEAPEGGRPAA